MRVFLQFKSGDLLKGVTFISGALGAKEGTVSSALGGVFA
jgi:hypothetical protein